MMKRLIIVLMFFMALVLQHFWYRETISELRGIVDIQTAVIKQQVIILNKLEETIDKLSNFLDDGSEKQRHLRYMLHKTNYNKAMTVVVTAYTPTVRECDSTPMIAASMERVRAGTIAVSRDLFYSGWTFGKKVYVQGKGIFQINDLMNERFQKRIDVFMWKKDDAKQFGKITAKAILMEEM